jgi:hypothetical protein
MDRQETAPKKNYDSFSYFSNIKSFLDQKTAEWLFMINDVTKSVVMVP